jgi:hypothetical protein
MVLLETVVGAFVKEGVSYLAGSLKSIRASRSSVARRFYALYQSLLEVQNAYRIAIEQHNDQTMEEYDNKLLALGRRLEDLQGVLEIYALDIRDGVKDYFSMDMSKLPDPAQVVVNSLRWHDLDHTIYERARSQLGAFIKDNFKMEDLL